MEEWKEADFKCEHPDCDADVLISTHNYKTCMGYADTLDTCFVDDQGVQHFHDPVNTVSTAWKCVSGHFGVIYTGVLCSSGSYRNYRKNEKHVELSKPKTQKQKQFKKKKKSESSIMSWVFGAMIIFIFILCCSWIIK